MFTKKALAFLSINALLCAYSFAAAAQDDETRRPKCESFNSLTVCNSVTAGSFITPFGPLFNGLRNYALFINTLAVTVSGTDVLWDASTAGQQSGISVNTTTGEITLPIGGTFLVIYFAQFDLPFDGNDNTGDATLRQGSSNLPNQRALISLHSAVGSNSVRQTASGMDIVKTTSSADNILSLRINLQNSATFPAALSNSANALMAILQLN